MKIEQFTERGLAETATGLRESRAALTKRADALSADQQRIEGEITHLRKIGAAVDLALDIIGAERTRRAEKEAAGQ